MAYAQQPLYFFSTAKTDAFFSASSSSPSRSGATPGCPARLIRRTESKSALVTNSNVVACEAGIVGSLIAWPALLCLCDYRLCEPLRFELRWPYRSTKKISLCLVTAPATQECHLIFPFDALRND